MNNKINYRGLSSLIFFLSESMFLGVGINQILNTSKNNCLISILIAILIGLLILLLFNRLANYEKDLDIIKKIDKLYGKIFGNIINFCLFILITLFFMYILWDTQIYIQNKYLDNTPGYVILLLFLLPVILSLNKGFKTVCKLSLMIYIISLFEILLTVFGIISYIDVNNFKPFFNASLFSTIKGAIYFISFFFTPLFLLQIVPKNQIDKPKKLNKSIFIFYLLSILSIFLLFTLILGVFGIELSSLFNYPEFVLVKKINYFNFIEHIENILCTEWMYGLYVTATLCLFYIQKYLENKNINNNFIYILIAFCLYFSLNLFKNTTIGYKVIEKYFHLTLSLPLLILLILSNILIKKKN